MEQYENNVSEVLAFLDENDYSDSVKRLHQRCYEDFASFLQVDGLPEPMSVVDLWLQSNKPIWNERTYSGYKYCMVQLQDIYEAGYIKPDHICHQKPPYEKLSSVFQELINTYLEKSIRLNSISEAGLNQARIACARFLCHVTACGITDISAVSYDTVISFYYSDHHRSKRAKGRCMEEVRFFLAYLNEHGWLCKKGLSVVLSCLLIDQVTKIEAVSGMIGKKISPQTDFPADEFYESIRQFADCLRSHHYSYTIIKNSRHTLTLLFIFLDMHGIGYDPLTAQAWFEEAKPFLGKGWKASRKTLEQFRQFVAEGDIIPGTCTVYKPDSRKSLPEWCRTVLTDFLLLKQREGFEPSTVTLYRSSVTRFLLYMTSHGVNSFQSVTPQLIKDFNTDDVHSTNEAKRAYNSKIRGFLFYLWEEGMVKSETLAYSLPASSAPKERSVKILSEDEVRRIEDYCSESRSPIAFRDAAILYLGLYMGLRGSDICNLRYTDIDWHSRKLSIIQQKTLTSLSLPIPVKVANAIYRYLVKGRPESESPYLFIRSTVPHGRLNRTACRAALIRALSGTPERGGGFHITRKTFASSMLNRGLVRSRVSETLGHRDTETVNKYLSLDERRIQLCALSLKETGISPKGGLFNA